jgi:serine phosphatase RsbU (regulator of sigma subunit)
VTAFYGVLHRPSGRLTYVRAGHERPLLARPGADPVVTTLGGDGRFLGMWPALSLTETAVTLQPGDRLVLYSDGLPDAVNPAGVHYGLPRLQQTLSQAITAGAAPTPSALVDHLIQDVSRWRQNADPFDDLTLLIVERVRET